MSSDHGKRVRWLLVASQRYYMYVFSKSNLNLLLRKLTTLLYVSPLFALIRSAIRLMSLSASLPIPPEVLNTAGVNIAFSPCSTRRYSVFFSFSWVMCIIWGMLRSQLVLACGLNILTCMNTLAKGDERFLALTSSRAPGAVLERWGSFSPVRSSSGGSIWTDFVKFVVGWLRCWSAGRWPWLRIHIPMSKLIQVQGFQVRHTPRAY